MKFKALVLDQSGDSVTAEVREVDERLLGEGELTIKVHYSTINYKDGMAITGTGKIVRSYPMIPGVDLAGEVVNSDFEEFSVGDLVVVTGFRMGELYPGGLSQFARVPARWAIKLPESISTRRAMEIGTAGLTSMLSILALEEHQVVPGSSVLVTGAAGGVGSTAVSLLSKLGYHVVASTGRRSEEPYLRELGASEIIDRSELSTPTQRPLLSERWHGAIDAVGGDTLSNILLQTRYGGCVASVGLAGGANFSTTVYPFLVRAVTLVGIDSVMTPLARRELAWSRLARDLDLSLLDKMVSYVSLSEVIDVARRIMKGEVRGRVVVDMDQES
ncbi:putative quinone oxidoreductase, YhdH/YhfP family [Ferrithrix thermotolerans DSM 19514]|uniref:Putative quinone oxidoreductase, YhdH/YhfP family n=1 Tax=Ferrithrix thermotolerans DSM 19514 TaxID=1121881 RepID=A0A1M4W1L4_9ACTN|nr:MDR family oxidoreductase [Ferrithrix thermotolerans]SHE75128.1 putative quinone oxidoreductase, YhdH/YhfP family [Ferrithrix thermotolerans DSM 19514]